MTQMSANRKEKKGIVKKEELKPRRDLTKQELQEYLELTRLCNARRYAAMNIEANTALIPNGKEVAETEMSIANLLENSKNNWISQVLTDCGIPKGQSVNINSDTGVIEEIKEEKKAGVKVEEVVKT